MMSLFLISWSDRHQTPAEEMGSDEFEPFPDFSAMSKEELMEYFSNYEFGKRGSPPVSFEITDMEGLPATPGIKTRNSVKCDVEMTVSSSSGSSTDSATLEVYENDVLIQSYKMYHSPKIVLEIDDANEYKYKIIPLGDVSDPKFYFQVGLKYGSVWVFNIYGEYTTQPFNYTCPEPTGGMCEVEWEITKYAGNATSYHVMLFPENGPPNQFVDETLLLGTPMTKTVNSNFSYTLYITPNGNGPNEFFTFHTSTPYLNVAMSFNLDMTDPNNHALVSNFDYYDCP